MAEDPCKMGVGVSERRSPAPPRSCPGCQLPAASLVSRRPESITRATGQCGGPKVGLGWPRRSSPDWRQGLDSYDAREPLASSTKFKGAPKTQQSTEIIFLKNQNGYQKKSMMKKISKLKTGSDLFKTLHCHVPGEVISNQPKSLWQVHGGYQCCANRLGDVGLYIVCIYVLDREASFFFFCLIFK